MDKVIHRVDMPVAGDELHHFGWNACSSCLCPYAPHPHMERRYLIVPGLRSSRIHVLDTKPDPRKPRMIKVIEAEEVNTRTGYSRPHTSHCGPDGIYMNAIGSRPTGEGPGGIFVHGRRDVRDQRAMGVGSRSAAAVLRLLVAPRVTTRMITSEWGTPDMVEERCRIPSCCSAASTVTRSTCGTSAYRTHKQMLDLGAEQQMVLELRPAHNPTETYGFAGVVTSLKDLSASVWIWYREGGNGNGTWKMRKVIEIPAQPAEPAAAPASAEGIQGAVPPLVTDLNLSLDDRFLYVSCFGTGELRQYDVTDPFNPVQTGSVQIGGIVHAHGAPASIGRQAVERRTADGRDQPRRQARLPHELALPDVG